MADPAMAVYMTSQNEEYLKIGAMPQDVVKDQVFLFGAADLERAVVASGSYRFGESGSILAEGNIEVPKIPGEEIEADEIVMFDDSEQVFRKTTGPKHARCRKFADADTTTIEIMLRRNIG